MDRKMVNFIKEQYPPGTRIRLNSMEDPYAPIAPGTEGVVDFVDDIGTIHMKWNNGRSLGIVPGEDSFSVLPPKLTTFKLYMPLTAELYEISKYGDLESEGTELDGSALRSYQDQIIAELVKNRMPEETERGLMHWYRAHPGACTHRPGAWTDTGLSVGQTGSPGLYPWRRLRFSSLCFSITSSFPAPGPAKGA